MDILRDLRRRSLQLDSGDVERFRSPSERRGSMASDSLSAAEKKGHSSGGLLHRFFTLSPYVFFFYLSFLLLFYSSEKILLLAPIPFSLNTALILSVVFGHLRRNVAANDKSDSREKEK